MNCAERKLEDEFYEHYKEVRERLYQGAADLTIPDFRGSARRLCCGFRKKLLDRFIFAFYLRGHGRTDAVSTAVASATI